jgi:septal ring factor EnvC (AmiA/AmiB activator)
LTTHKFATQAEEIAYLKKMLEDKQQEVDEVESSFSEFQEFSKQLEEEMEQELKANEKKYAELLSQHKRLKEEHENTVVGASISI